MSMEIKKMINRINELEEVNLKLRTKNRKLEFENERLKRCASRMCDKTLNILDTHGLKFDEIMRLYGKDENE